MNEARKLPSGFQCRACSGTGLSHNTAEPIEAMPDFKPKPLPCSDCSLRAEGVPHYTRGTDDSPYSIWWSP